jgi:hypothetical protein
MDANAAFPPAADPADAERAAGKELHAAGRPVELALLGDDAAAAARSWADLPDDVLAAVACPLPADARARMRLACRAFAAAAAGAPNGVRIHLPDLAAGGAAAELALARACPRATRALLRLPLGAAAPPDADALARLFGLLLSTKPRLASIQIQETRDSAFWGGGGATPPGRGPAWLAALCDAATASARGRAPLLPGAISATSGALFVAGVELCLTDAPSPAELARLSALPALRSVALHVQPPHRAGAAPDGLRELARLPLESLALPVDASRALDVRALEGTKQGPVACCGPAGARAAAWQTIYGRVDAEPPQEAWRMHERVRQPFPAAALINPYPARRRQSFCAPRTSLHHRLRPSPPHAQAWSAVRDLPSTPAGSHLTQLQLR